MKITDSGFETFGREDSKWSIFAYQDVGVRASLDDSVLSLALSKTRGANWHGALIYSPFSVEVGDVFKLEFSARAKCPFSFSVWLGQQNEPYRSLVPDENHFGEKMMDVEWQTFSHVWQPILDERLARLVFVLGQIDNVVEIKDVLLSKN